MGKVKDFITNHKTAVIIATISIVVIVGLAIGIPCGIFFAPKHGKLSTYAYDKTADFDYTKDGYVIKKSDNKDFKVLNIADLQMSEVYTAAQNKRNYDLVRKLVEQEKPDLLTFTGDNFWLYNAKGATKKFIENIDSLNVPWAPVFGNHEPETEVDKNWIIEQFLTANNCIFNYGENANRVKDLAKGPNNIDGVGNYVINVLNSQNKIIHTIFMMDSHSNNGNQHPENVKDITQGTAIDGLDGWYTKDNYIFKPNKEDSGKFDAVGTKYDFIKQNQIEWYEWVVKGISKLENAQLNENAVVPSSAYFHIPLPEFNIAYALYEKELIQKFGSIKDKDGNYTIDGREEVNGNF
ncbi:MAG: metallophosphoesterase, partial [Clostridia bacterium]|nr:metallophosphoesterase [Clostridia bacterium]